METTLLIMAAGIGSRFGGGIKQLEPVDNNNHIIMDYSIHDAIEAGFNHVVFIIRRDIEEEFKEVIGERIAEICEKHGVTVDYAFQDINDIPGSLPEGRTKPWGTGQAVLVAKNVLHTPFIVINADDYYGKEGFKAVHEYLVNGGKSCMAGFVLKNTLSDNGGVTRGICKMDDSNNLTKVDETKNIIKTENGAEADGVIIDIDSLVSMNMWGLTLDFLEVLEDGFKEFFETEVSENPLKSEYLIPTFIGELLEQDRISVKVLRSNDTWYMVFVDDLLLLRHTLLWTNDSHYKATPLICKRIDKNSTLDRIIVNSAMYNVYAEYINRLKTDSMVIEIKQYGNSAKNETKAKKSHREWRERLYYLRKSKKLKGQIIMHKLYRSQLISDLHSTWDPRFRSFSAEINWGDEGESGFFNPDKLDGKIDSPDKLYDASNLLNDDTQKILLPYIKETEHLLNGMVKRYDKCGEAHIFPSLDVGFPNNILRLAGGFATGMLVVWKSGTPLVPVDTTVNVCSSSYYEFDESALKGRKVSDFFNQKIIQNIINKGSVKEGLAFSFNTGNHFILLSKSRNTGHYFLVLHSSAKQYKDTYLGLYPKPHNWYSNLIKTYQEKGSDRYIHYLKDDEALRFISIARSLNEQNRDIHNWFASEIFGDIKPIQQKTYHHYGMPTDYSIAIGTYVVDERDVVPIFSREGYPIFLFRPSSNMWSIVLEGKTKYIIPHGWGQELRYDYFAKQIQKEDFKNGKLSIKNGKFVLSNSQHGYYEKKFDIDYSARFNKKQVGVRDLYKTDKFDGKNIFGDTPYIKGTIEEILDPVALFSSDTEGAVKYYVSGEEN